MSKEVMVVKRELILGQDNFQGFKPATDIDYESRILSNFEWMPRDLAEQDPRYKQPVGYALIINPISKKVFTYQRTNKKECGEERLRGKFSWGIGGHIEGKDHKTTENPLQSSTLREIREEISPLGVIQFKIAGYINSEIDTVGQVHFGLLYVVQTNLQKVFPITPEIKDGKLRTLQEIEEICASPDFDIENWSLIALEPLKRYLN